MAKKEFSWKAFNEVPIIGIVRNITFEELKQILPLYTEAGLTTIEITMNTPSAKKMISFAAEQYINGLNVGAGTVCTKKDLDKAFSSGAQFVITPVVNKKVIKKCVAAQIPIFPGAFTPTEIYTAWKLGATMVKLYPANAVTPQYISDIKAPLTKIKLLPTGGINLNNMISFMKAGANGVGLGAGLFDKTLIKNKDWRGLKLHFEAFVKQVKTNI